MSLAVKVSGSNRNRQFAKFPACKLVVGVHDDGRPHIKRRYSIIVYGLGIY